MEIKIEDLSKFSDSLFQRFTPVLGNIEAKIDRLCTLRTTDFTALQVLQNTVTSLEHRVDNLEKTEKEFETHKLDCAKRVGACPASDIKKLQWGLFGSIFLLLATTALKAAGII